MGMIDIANKDAIKRTAKAIGKIQLKRETLDKIMSGDTRKGDPLHTAEIACLFAVKKTPELIAHCHQIPIEKIKCDFEYDSDCIIVSVEVKTTAKTGVEMEALVGVTTALNTIWDMVKYLEKDEEGKYLDTKITDIQVIEKKKE